MRKYLALCLDLSISLSVRLAICAFLFFETQVRDKVGRWHFAYKKDNLRNKDDLKNEDKLKNEDDLKKKDDLNNEDDL